MSYINQFIILQFGPPLLHYCTLPKKVFPSLSVWVRREYLGNFWRFEFLKFFHIVSTDENAFVVLI